MKKGQKLPRRKNQNLRKGQQVALYSDKKGLRLGYEFVEALNSFYVVRNTETGKTHRVWMNKVLNMDGYKKKLAEIEAYNAKIEAETYKKAD
jgi:hypothetical protein